MRKLFLLSLFWLIGNNLLASHLIGGKITYRHLGSNQYEIKLTVYRDCGVLLDYDSPAYLSVFSKVNNSLFFNTGLFLLTRDTVKATNSNPCFVPPPGICVETGVYIDTLFLPPNGAGYTIVYQRCCRNNSVINISLPHLTGTSITADIPTQPNNSANIINPPPIYVCLSDTFKYSLGANDPDGDSLVYQLCTPLSGAHSSTPQPNPASPPPYSPIIWTPPHTGTNPIPNTGGITLNSSTGFLKFKPSMIGQFGIGVCVLEYRNGNLINTNRLDIQLNIVNCYLVASIPTATNLCKGLNIIFQNASTNATSYFWNFGDLTTLADTSHVFAPSYTFPNYGTYTITLTATNTNYGLCQSTATKVITVNPLLSPTLQPNYSACFKNNFFNFNVGGAFHPSAIFNWQFPNANPPSAIVNPATTSFTNPSPQNVVVSVSQFGCTESLVATVTFSNPVAKTDKDKLDCFGTNLSFPNLSTNANQFFWDFGDLSATNDTSSLNSPTYLYPNFNTYTITLIAKDGVCSDTLKLPIVVNTTLALHPVTSFTPQCYKGNSFNFLANGIYGSNPVFSWSFGSMSSPLFSNAENPTGINFLAPGIHTVELSISEYGCTKTRKQTVQVLPSPKANISVSDTIGCQPLFVKFNSKDSVPQLNFWNINDDLFIDTTVNYIFQNSGLFSFSIVVRDSSHCTDTISKTNFIQVYPKPQAKSLVTPLKTSILNPEIEFIDSTSTFHSTLFYFGDQNTSNEVYNKHIYSSEGAYSYSLIVINQYGCSDTVSDIITIEGIPYGFVPNVFTPNGDGVNEHFKIRGEYINSSSMSIFNRWGSLMFETSDALIGWDGKNIQNDAPCENGVYFYIIKITLKNEKSYSFKGNVSLFK